MKRLNQYGGVSLLTVAIFAIIITVVTTIYIRSVVAQQKNALNYDLNTRAYYAAESGVQDTILALESTLPSTNKDSCAPNGSGVIGGNNAYRLGYTCQLLMFEPNEISGEVKANMKHAMVRLDPADLSALGPPYKLVARWSRKDAAQPPNLLHPRCSSESSPLFPKINEWYGCNTGQQVHAMLKLTLITVPKTGGVPVTRDNIRQRVLFVNPAHDSRSNAVTVNSGDSTGTQQQNLVSNGSCYVSDSGSPSGDYSCIQTFTITGSEFNLANYDMYVRVSSVYRDTGFSLQLQNNTTGNPVGIKNSQAIIDITGKAGDNNFSRVRQTVSIGGYFEEEGPDAALIAAEGICKLYSLGLNANAYSEGCNSLN